MPARANGANGQAPDRAYTIETLRRYADVFGRDFARAIPKAKPTARVRTPETPAPLPVPVVRERVVTKTTTVVRDGGWREKAREARAELRDAKRELARKPNRNVDQDRELDQARFELSKAIAAKEFLDKRLAVANRQLEQLRDQEAAAVQRAVESRRVFEAERRADAAEARADAAERQAAEQARAVTGELRPLTRAEMNELKTNGPAGPAVLADALKRLTRARKDGGRTAMAVALTDVAKAAMHWRARL